MSPDRQHTPPFTGARLPPNPPRWLAVGLCTVMLVTVVGTISSVVPSMAFRPEGTDIMYEYGLSAVIAPLLLAAILIVTARALRPSRRRLLTAALTILGASPFLFGIKLAREPWFDIDNEFVLLAPWAVQTYVACVSVLLGAGIALLAYARRLDGDAGIAAAPARIVRDEMELPGS